MNITECSICHVMLRLALPLMEGRGEEKVAEERFLKERMSFIGLFVIFD